MKKIIFILFIITISALLGCEMQLTSHAENYFYGPMELRFSSVCIEGYKFAVVKGTWRNGDVSIAQIQINSNNSERRFLKCQN